MANLLDSLLQNVTAIEVETKYTPSMMLDNPFAPSAEGGLMSYLQPRVTIFTKNLSPFVAKPWGNPDPSKWPMVKMGLFAAGVLIMTGLISLGEQVLRKRG